MADGKITVEVSTQAAQAELVRLRAENAALKRDLQYARDGLTKGRSRMREDNERLLLALREIADDYADRFDMDSPSTNPGMKYVVQQARDAIVKATGCKA